MKTSTKLGVLGLIASGLIAGAEFTSGSDTGIIGSITDLVTCSSTAIAGEVCDADSKEAYVALSGDSQAYYHNRMNDADIEKKLGLSREDIKELTKCFNYYKSVDLKRLTDAIPGLNKDQLKQLMELPKMNSSFVEYAVRAGEFDLDAMTRAFSDKDSNAFTNYLSRLVSSDFRNVMSLYKQFREAWLSPYHVGFFVNTNRFALPEEISCAMVAPQSNDEHFKILWDKGYSIEDINKLAGLFLYTKDRRDGIFDYFMKLGVTDADEAIELSGKYGMGIAEELCEVGLTFDDLPLIKRVGEKDTVLYARAGMKGDIDAMLFLQGHGVNGELAEFYSHIGINDKNHMAILANRNLKKGVFSQMQRLGFLDDSKTYKIGELIIAHDAYRGFISDSFLP